MNLLARRDHSQRELQQKLLPRFPDKPAISQAIAQLQQDGLQDDLRFAESYVRWRAARGYGVQRIEQELAQKGVQDELIAAALANNGIDWQQLLQQQYQKKYGNLPPPDLTEKARCTRFLLGRGFSYGELNQLWRSLPL